MNDLKHATPGRNYIIIGMVKNVRNILTKANKSMGVVTIETFDGDLDIVLFSKAWKEFQPMIAEEKALAFIGQIDLRNADNPQLRCDTVQEIADLSKTPVVRSKLHIVLEGSYTEQQLEKLREFMLDHEGGCSVFLHIREPEKETVVLATHQIKVKSDFEIPEDSELKTFVSDIWAE